MRWILLALVACTGCDIIFGLQKRPEDVPIDAVAIDAPVDSGQPARCATPLLDDPFDAAPACGTWGGPTATNATLEETNGELVISLPRGGGYGSCTHASTVSFAGGVELEVTAVVGAAAFIQVNAYADIAGTVDAYLYYREGMFSLFTTASDAPVVTKSFDTATMRWWRLRPEPDGVVAEYSPDGENYQRLGIAEGPPPAAVKSHFGVGGDDLVDPTSARFGHLRVCEN